MIPKADLIVKEVLPTPNFWCKCGHVAPLKFRRDVTGETPTRFFQVTSVKTPGVNGTYCEPCLIVANAMRHVANPKSDGNAHGQ